MIRRPFKGAHFYEWQIGPVVLQVRHAGGDPVAFRRVYVWRDPYWRRSR